MHTEIGLIWRDLDTFREHITKVENLVSTVDDVQWTFTPWKLEWNIWNLELKMLKKAIGRTIGNPLLIPCLNLSGHRLCFHSSLQWTLHITFPLPKLHWGPLLALSPLSSWTSGTWRLWFMKLTIQGSFITPSSSFSLTTPRDTASEKILLSCQSQVMLQGSVVQHAPPETKSPG